MSKRSPIPPELFLFLDDLSRNNNRDWFTANKTRYEDEVRQPVLQWIEPFMQFLCDVIEVPY